MSDDSFSSLKGIPCRWCLARSVGSLAKSFCSGCEQNGWTRKALTSYCLCIQSAVRQRLTPAAAATWLQEMKPKHCSVRGLPRWEDFVKGGMTEMWRRRQ